MKKSRTFLIISYYLISRTNIKYFMVGVTGIEPVTPAVSRQCSTAELRTQYLINYSKIRINL